LVTKHGPPDVGPPDVGPPDVGPPDVGPQMLDLQMLDPPPQMDYPGIQMDAMMLPGRGEEEMNLMNDQT